MKIKAIKLLSATLSLCTIFVFAGCGNEKPQSSEIQTESSTIQDVTIALDSKDFNIRNFHEVNNDSTDGFTGYWKITEGAGSQFKNFVFCFDGNGKSSLIIDNVVYTSKYTIEDKADENNEMQSVFSTKLMFGINGDYTYKINDDHANIELTSMESRNTTVISKINKPDFVPTPSKNPTIDEKLLGAWESADGCYLYFDKDGIMYENQFDAQYSYAKYSISNGVITYTYKMQDEVTDTYDYKLTDNTLNINGQDYSRISDVDLK